jgi:amino acid transporter
MLKRVPAPATRTAPAPANAAQRREHQHFGWAGLAFGMLALALAILPGWVAPLYDPPSKPIPQQAADWLGELKDKTVAAIRMESVPPPPSEFHNPWRDPRIVLGSLLLAFAALVLGIIAFVRHEDQRMVACAVALAAGAIASAHLLTAVMILAFAVLVGVLLARHG